MSYATFFTLFHKARRLGVIAAEDHHDLVADITEGKTTSLRQLTPRELRDIERVLQGLIDPAQESAQRMRRKLIAILASRGAVDAHGKPDMAHINAWVMKYGHAKKPLMQYTNAELTQLVTQAEHIVATDLKAIRSIQHDR